MALNKKIILENGCEVNYHRISSISLHLKDAARAQVIVDSYVNEDYRKLEQPVTSDCYLVNVTTEEEESTGIRVLLYNKLKELEVWTDALDC